MTFGFKLSHRLARGFVLAGTLGTLAACAGDNLTQPTDSTNPVNTISLSPATASLAVSSTLQLDALLRDSAGVTLSGRTISWKSDAGSIATVSASGLVLGADTGTATITASSEGKTASATVRVTRATATTSVAHAGYFVSPSGSSGADGSMAHPWSLAAALAGGNGHVQPGDTIWLRGGTYRGSFTSTVSGTSGKPVVIRQYPGEHALINGAGAARTATILDVTGPWVVLWGFEITDTDADRTWSQTGNAGRPHGLANYASHTKYISLLVHDAGTGIYNDANQSDVEIVGCVFYNNGWQGPDRGHGHGVYIRSNTGPVTARDNVMFNQFGYGIHVYTNPGEAKLNNVHLDDNIVFDNGLLSNNSSSANILLGGDDTADRDDVSGNVLWYATSSTSINLRVGYGSLVNGSVSLTNNYVAGGSPVLDLGYWKSLTANGNNFLGTSSLLSLEDPSVSSSKFSGQTSSSMPSTTKVFTRKVPYETGRVNVAVFNWGKAGTVSVNLDGMLPLGSQYEIHNVQDMNGSPVVSGTFTGGSVTVPIQAVSAPAPVGWSKRPGTGTDFAAFVVTIRQ
jgi:Bacterial Ig-like domain (group 2)/Right handed beta helix region